MALATSERSHTRRPVTMPESIIAPAKPTMIRLASISTQRVAAFARAHRHVLRDRVSVWSVASGCLCRSATVTVTRQR